MVIKMNIIGLFARYYVDAFSVALAPHAQTSQRNNARAMPSLAARARAEATTSANKEVRAA